MFILTEARYQLTRNKGRSLLMILVALFLLGALAFYLGGMQSNQTALNELGDKLPVKVQIVTEDGSRSSGLFIHKNKVDQLVETGVRDVRATTAAAGALSEAAKLESPFAGGDVTIVGLNTIQALPLSRVEYDYAEGFDETLFEGSAALCVLEAGFAEENGFSLGSAITLPVYFYPRGYGEYIEMGEQTLLVAGTFSTKQAGGISMLVPAGWLRAEAEAQDMKYFGYDSLSMVVDDPLHLNAFKDKLTEAGMAEPISESEDYYTGAAAVVEDEIYTKTADKFRENIQVYRTFLLPFFLLMIGLSCLVLFLALRGSRVDMAIASSLGRTKGQIALTHLLSVLALYLLGCVLSLPVMAAAAGLGLSGALAICGLFLLFGCAGAVIALALLLRFHPLILLTKVD